MAHSDRIAHGSSERTRVTRLDLMRLGIAVGVGRQEAFHDSLEIRRTGAPLRQPASPTAPCTGIAAALRLRPELSASAAGAHGSWELRS